jgi:hypothetical protein
VPKNRDIERDEYYSGETIKAKLLCDNSKCKKAIKSFKIVLIRKIYASGFDDKETEQTKVVKEFKDVMGCSAKGKIEIDLEMKIPEKDHQVVCFSVFPEEEPMWVAFSCTVFGQIIKVTYLLKVLIKHDAWNVIGEGDSITMPVKIMHKDFNLSAPSDFNTHLPRDWNP